MPSLLTKTGIWNLALDTIREAPVQDQLVNSAPVKWLTRNYEHSRDVLLRSYVWNFAKAFRELTPELTPDWNGGWDYRYALPPDAVRLLRYTYDGKRTGKSIPHEIIGSSVYSNHSSARVLVIERKDEGLFDPLFVEALASTLALGMANKFTAKNKYIELSRSKLDGAIAKAEEIDALEGTSEPLEDFDIIDVRA